MVLRQQDPAVVIDLNVRRKTSHVVEESFFCLRTMLLGAEHCLDHAGTKDYVRNQYSRNRNNTVPRTDGRERLRELFHIYMITMSYMRLAK